jgi:electron transport complex protein RnfG
MNLHKQVTTTALLLMIFATIGAAIVGLTYDNTAEQIAINHERVLLKQLNHILPADKYDNDLLLDKISLDADKLLGLNEPATAYIATLKNKPVGVVLPAVAPNGYNGSIYLLVGIYADGSLAGVRVTLHRETPGLGDAIEENRSDWILGFAGKSLQDPTEKKWKVKRDGGEFDQFTGATITPRAVVKAVHSALLYFAKQRETLFKLNNSET